MQAKPIELCSLFSAILEGKVMGRIRSQDKLFRSIVIGRESTRPDINFLCSMFLTKASLHCQRLADGNIHLMDKLHGILYELIVIDPGEDFDLQTFSYHCCICNQSFQCTKPDLEIKCCSSVCNEAFVQQRMFAEVELVGGAFLTYLTLAWREGSPKDRRAIEHMWSSEWEYFRDIVLKKLPD